MQGIYVAAIITSLFSLSLIGGFILWKTSRQYWSLIIIAVIIQLPMSYLAFHFVRIPLDGLLQGIVGNESSVYKIITTFYAPLTEEPVKLIPLLFPLFYKQITIRNVVCVAMALGLGFGVGEIWMLADLLSSKPEIASLEWYMLSGFVSERFLVCIMHGVFTSVALKQLHNKFILGILGAMLLHYIGNLPVFLSAINLFGFGKETWTVILSLWVIGYFFIMMFVLTKLVVGKYSMGRFFFGKAKCPDCNTVYPRPLFGVNLVTKRYEKCPNCQKWHLL